MSTYNVCVCGVSNNWPQHMFSWRKNKNIHFFCLKQRVPAQNKTYIKPYATSKDLDQPVHMHSLIRVFIDLLYLLQPPGYPKRKQ